MLERFQQQYGILKPALHYHSPFELLVAVVLSAQCTDERVNVVTGDLFPLYNTPKKMLELGLQGLESKIRTCGLYHSKAQHLLETSAILCENMTEKCRSLLKNLSNFLVLAEKQPMFL